MSPEDACAEVQPLWATLSTAEPNSGGRGQPLQGVLDVITSLLGPGARAHSPARKYRAVQELSQNAPRPSSRRCRWRGSECSCLSM